MTCAIIAHTRFEDAVDVLASSLQRDQQADPLAVTTLLVQGNVIGRWLSTELAQRSPHGIAAGLDLRPVGAFCRGLVAPPSGPDPYAVESLIWTVDAALNDRAWIDAIPDGQGLRLALSSLDRAGTHALSVHLAGILDRYQFERPDWIATWTAGKTVAAAAQTPWLASLWARIRAQAGRLSPLSVRLEQLTTSLAAGEARPLSCPSAFWLIAPSSLPPLLIRLLTALGDHGKVDVRILHLVPAKHASLWTALENERVDYDPETTPMDEALAGAHQLLAVYGRQSHDLAVMLADRDEGQTRLVDFDTILPRQRADDASLLEQLQSQIWDAQSGPLVRRGRDDRSLTVHRCHSPLREVEVLRDALIDALARADAPRPDEVLVAVTDLKTYGPLLTAVLGEERGDHIRFPVRIVGEPAVADPLITALLAILALPGSDASLEAVLAPCDAPAISRRFGLDEQDLGLLRHRLSDAGVSWGIDAQQRQNTNGYASDEGSWRSGVDRLLLGLATGPQEVVWSDHFAAGAQLLGEADAIGGIAVYLSILQRFAEAVGDGTTTKPVSTWRTLLYTLIADLTDAQRGTDALALTLVRGAIAAIPSTAADPDLRTIRKHLMRMLEEEQNASTWSRGGITVAPLTALRHAPHAVIAILGLDSSFPRTLTASAFDPAAMHRRRGDLSPRLDSRQQFLDLLLAARKRVHLSWTGWSAADGSPREPSAVIEDLLRYLDDHCSDLRHPMRGRTLVLTAHRLHASDAAYFNDDLPRSHDVLSCAAAQARAQRDAGIALPGVRPFILAEATSEIPEQVSPEVLITWCCDPAKSFAEQVLALRFPHHETLADHEPIDLDGLEDWTLRQTLLDSALSHHPLSEIQLRQDGLLPHGPAGTNLLDDVRNEVQAITNTLDALLQAHGSTRDHQLSSTKHVTVPLPHAGVPRRVEGTIARCTNHVALSLHSGKLKGRHLLAGWVLHQLVNAHARHHGEPGITTLILGNDVSQGFPTVMAGGCALAPGHATDLHWTMIADTLRSTWRRPQPIFPDLAASCWDWETHTIKELVLADHLEAWRRGADDSDDTFTRSELATPKAWTKLVWRGIADPTSQWSDFLTQMWGPAARVACGGAPVPP